MNKSIICFGETVWDAMPRALYLGGAPFNVAAHLTKHNVPACMVSRIGDDVLGHEVLRNMKYFGMDIGLIQMDAKLPTGFVLVELTDGHPSYEILEPSAWDEIAWTHELQETVSKSRALIYGTLSQRGETTRETLHKLWEIPCKKVFDINLRPPFISQKIVEASLVAANIVKANDEEFNSLKKWFDLPEEDNAAMEALADTFQCHTVCITRGAEGSILLNHGRFVEQPVYSVDVVDTVGAGDAFLASLTAGLLDGDREEDVMQRAGKVAAFVASQKGAVPDYKISDVDNLAIVS